MSNYWKDRQEQRLIDFELDAKETQKQIALLLREAKRNIDKQINEIYLTYSGKTGLSVDELSLIINGSERANFLLSIQKKMQDLGMMFEDVYHEGYLARLSRLDALKEEIYWEMVKLAPKEVAIMEQTFSKIAIRNYAEVGQDLREFNIKLSFSSVDTRVVEQVLGRKWYGSNFSSRVWKNTEGLARSLTFRIGSALAMGQSYQKTSKEIRDAFGVATHEAQRLVRTESSYIYNQSTIARYKEAKIRYYQYSADLEGNYCSKCEGLNEKSFRVADQEVGENYPPMHPNCRCTTYPLFEEDKLDLEKIKEAESRTTEINPKPIEQELITARPDKNSRHIYYFTKDTTAEEITDELGTNWVSRFRENPNN